MSIMIKEFDGYDLDKEVKSIEKKTSPKKKSTQGACKPNPNKKK